MPEPLPATFKFGPVQLSSIRPPTRCVQSQYTPLCRVPATRFKRRPVPCLQRRARADREPRNCGTTLKELSDLIWGENGRWMDGVTRTPGRSFRDQWDRTTSYSRVRGKSRGLWSIHPHLKCSPIATILCRHRHSMICHVWKSLNPLSLRSRYDSHRSTSLAVRLVVRVLPDSIQRHGSTLRCDTLLSLNSFLDARFPL